MVNARIYIAVPTLNRRSVIERCLPTLLNSKGPEDMLVIFDDGSSEYSLPWLTDFCDVAISNANDEGTIGTEAQRRRHLREFWKNDNWSHLYFTDPDAPHDPTWRAEMLRIQEKYDGLPLCGYDTEAHVRLLGNTLEDDPASEVIIRQVAPGISYLLTREHVRKIIPFVDHLQAFDWQIPAMLGSRFAITRRSLVSHVGWGGLRHPVEEGIQGGDVPRNPTDWLIGKRQQIVAELKALHPA